MSTNLKLATSQFELEQEEIRFSAKTIEYMKRNGLTEQVFRNRLDEHVLLIKTDRVSYDMIDLSGIEPEEEVIAINDQLAFHFDEKEDEYLIFRGNGSTPLTHYNIETMKIIDL